MVGIPEASHAEYGGGGVAVVTLLVLAPGPGQPGLGRRPPGGRKRLAYGELLALGARLGAVLGSALGAELEAAVGRAVGAVAGLVVVAPNQFQ